LTLDAATLAVVALGGAVGGMARFGIGALFDRLLGGHIPFGTLVVNVSGAFALGWLAAAVVDHGTTVWAALAIGVLGSYTTVSALALQVAVLAEEHVWPRALFYLLVTLVLGLAAAALGFRLGGAA
jgi:CrcB protein